MRHFQATHNGVDVFNVRTDKGSFSYTKTLEGYMAAHWWRMTLEEWDTIDGVEQSRYMAVYRVNNQIQAIQATKARKVGGDIPSDSPFRER